MLTWPRSLVLTLTTQIIKESNMIIDNKDLFEDIDSPYNEYLEQHISNVAKGYEWLKENLPEVISEDNYIEETTYYGELEEIIAQHDKSKYNKIPDSEKYFDLTCEYDAYNEWFYGEQNDETKKDFQKAWLAHIHANPHHWQHWMLQNDEEGLVLLDMPYVFIIEMISDWWSFSWKTNKLDEIFSWYDKNKKGILLSDKTRKTVESILDKIKDKLNENA